jgi:tRNA(fMet)-specific endonuclease VapC
VTNYLLDTNILVHAIRGDAIWQEIKKRFDPLMMNSRPEYCFVSEGELRSLSKQWNWGELKVQQMEFFLQYFVRQSIENKYVIEAYSIIDAYSTSIGISMGKNDIWIAATTHISGSTLITTDADFNHLDQLFISIASLS